MANEPSPTPANQVPTYTEDWWDWQNASLLDSPGAPWNRPARKTPHKVGNPPKPPTAESAKQDYLRSKEVAWNPPAHALTRAPQLAYDRTGRTPDKVVEGVTRGRQGRIYTTLYQGTNAAFQDGTRYGLKFHYNPTSISYAYATDPDRDPTANYVIFGAGLVNVNFEIYLNRIYDMDRPGPSNYQPALDWATISEIKSRGTEYDLEFLYRAVNGDPVPVSHTTYMTADWGALTFTPLTVQLGRSGLLFDGLLNSVQVNHILFTGDMVPTFTQVSLSFARMLTNVAPGAKGGHQPTDGGGFLSSQIKSYPKTTQAADEAK